MRDDLDRRLEELFMKDSHSRRVDEVRIAPRRRSPLLLGLAVAGAAVLALVAGLTLGSLRDGRQDVAAPSASAAATATATATTAAAATPTASPGSTGAQPSVTPGTAAGVLSDAFGVLVTGGEFRVIRETDGRTVGPLEPQAAPGTVRGGGFAVSSDGRRVAYWAQSGSGRNQLWLWDASAPDGSRLLLASRDGERGTGVVWSSDGEALLVTSDSLARLQGIDAPPERSFARTILLSGRPGPLVEADVHTAERISLQPVGYDRRAGVTTVVEVGAGAFARAYLVITQRDFQTRTEARTELANTLRVVASPDARWVVSLTDIQGSGRLVAWPLASPGQRKELAPSADRAISHAGWRPGTNQVLVLDATTGRGPVARPSTFRVWDPETGAQSSIGFEGAASAAFRADGSALYGLSLDGREMYVVELPSGKTERIPGATGIPIGGVRLR